MRNDNLDEDPYDFVKYIVEKYNFEIVILGCKAKGVLIYSGYADSYASCNSIGTSNGFLTERQIENRLPLFRKD